MIQFGNDKIKEIYYGSDGIKEVYYGSELVWFKPSYVILTNGTRIDFAIENTPIANFCNRNLSNVINGVSYYSYTFKEIHFGSSYSGVTEIDNHFLGSGCTSLTNITLNFPASISVGDNFLSNAISLTSATLNFPKLNSVGHHFLYYCGSLTNITLNFPALSSISTNFLMGCTSLTNITLNFPVLNSISNGFLRYCPSLPSVTLNFPKLNSVGNNFLSGCDSLANITLTTETPPITDSDYFLRDADLLTSIYVPANSVNLYKTTSPWSNKSSVIKAI